MYVFLKFHSTSYFAHLCIFVFKANGVAIINLFRFCSRRQSKDYDFEDIRLFGTFKPNLIWPSTTISVEYLVSSR